MGPGQAASDRRAARLARHLSPLASPTGTAYPAGASIDLRGNMEPVGHETSGPMTCIRGAVPQLLDGAYIRNGPNPYWLEAALAAPYHVFNGHGMLHQVELCGGQARYSNKWVRTKRLELERRRGRPLKGMVSFDEQGNFMGQANTALVYHNSRLMALYEGDRPYVLGSGLQTTGQQDLGHPITAHPKVCPVTGELVYFGYSVMEPVVNYGVASPSGVVLTRLEVPTRCGRPVMMHDMAITTRHSILLEFPLVLDPERIAAGKMPYIIDETQPSRFGVLPRHAQKVEQIQWFEGETLMAFHIANAWESGDRIVMVGTPQKGFSFDFAKSSPSQFYEWTFDLGTGVLTERVLATAWVEFPIVAPQLVGQQCRYCYAALFHGPEPGLEFSPFHAIFGIAKLDLSTGALTRHEFVDGRFGGEAVFVPSRQGSSEDEGYLLCFTFNPHDSSTELYVIDATTMGPEPVAILQTPARVPFGFHGTWLNRNQLDQLNDT